MNELKNVVTDTSDGFGNQVVDDMVSSMLKVIAQVIGVYMEVDTKTVKIELNVAIVDSDGNKSEDNH